MISEIRAKRRFSGQFDVYPPNNSGFPTSMESGIKSFGIKTKKIRKGKQFSKNVSDMIQMKNFLYRKLQEAHISDHTEIETMSS